MYLKIKIFFYGNLKCGKRWGGAPRAPMGRPPLVELFCDITFTVDSDCEQQEHQS